MISDKNKELANWALKHALENGCSDARVKVYFGNDNAFDYRDEQLDRLEQSVEACLTINLFVDGRYSSFSTNRMDKDELTKFINNSIEAARLLAPDKYRKLPDPNRLFKEDSKSLDVFDKEIENVSIDEKLNLLKETVKEVYGKDERLISVSSSYSDGITASYFIDSNGFEGYSESTYYSLSAEVSMKGNEDARPSSFWYDTSIFWKDLSKGSIAKKAYERVLQKLNQEKIISGKYKMLIDNLNISRLLSPIISSLYGSSIDQKNSFLIDKFGERIISDQITILDDPHIRQGRGARWFDGEGVATKKMDIVKNGILNNYYIDTYYSGKLNMIPTIQSPSVLVMEPGTKDFNQLLSSLDRGIWVTGFNGGNTNSTTGDFSFGIEGFLIEKGQLIKSLSEMNITGNLLDLWQNVIEVGSDLKLNSSWRIPSVLFGEVIFNGK